MAKLKTDPITALDLTKYLETSSDFGFELQILNVLLGLGFRCEHGGSYRDPNTEKVREFDIRAFKDFYGHMLRLAVECKNLRANFPILVSTVPRRLKESYHDLCVSIDTRSLTFVEPKKPTGSFNDVLSTLDTKRSCKVVRLEGDRSLYHDDEYVGKSLDQIGIAVNGEFSDNDQDVYSKWSQALSSAQELVKRSREPSRRIKGDINHSLILPILVVPNGRLWEARFDSEGRPVRPVTQVDRCPYFVDFTYLHDFSEHSFNSSHLEIVTVDGLTQLIAEKFEDIDQRSISFQAEYVRQCVKIYDKKSGSAIS